VQLPTQKVLQEDQSEYLCPFNSKSEDDQKQANLPLALPKHRYMENKRLRLIRESI